MSSRNLSQSKISHLTKITNFTASLYDSYFKLWLRQESAFRQMVIDLMDIGGSESVLDVGCGTGRLTLMIAERINGKGNIFGIDLSPQMIEVAKKKANNQGSQVDYRIATSLALPFGNQTFEVVTTSLVYHQLISWQERVKTVSEIWRVLKPGGRYISAEFNRLTLGNMAIIHDSLIRRIPLFGPALLEENGFSILRRVEATKGIMIISAKKVVCRD
ncbi:MAG: class I SAM-dependent methyltransferase [Chloroflexi bacterium]|nr:class I SAM-dependent methyltransferase [Chloroflexota bacterium]